MSDVETLPQAAPVRPTLPPPMGLLAELTHRCSLRCPYCSNPLELDRRSRELSTSEWKRLIDEAAALGVLHIYFSGGEPMLRRDIAELVAHAHDGCDNTEDEVLEDVYRTIFRYSPRRD